MRSQRAINSGSSLETIRNMVASGLGVSVLPASALGSRYASRLLRAVPFTAPIPSRKVALAWRASFDRPMAIETLHVPRRLFPDLHGDDLTGQSFYDLVHNRYGLTMAHGTQVIEPTVTNEEESEALDVPLHSPAFLFERTTKTPDGAVIEFVRSVYRGDRYKLLAELAPPATIPAPPAPPIAEQAAPDA